MHSCFIPSTRPDKARPQDKETMPSCAPSASPPNGRPSLPPTLSGLQSQRLRLHIFLLPGWAADVTVTMPASSSFISRAGSLDGLLGVSKAFVFLFVCGLCAGSAVCTVCTVLTGMVSRRWGSSRACIGGLCCNLIAFVRVPVRFGGGGQTSSKPPIFYIMPRPCVSFLPFL